MDSEEKNNLISNTASIMLNFSIGVDQNYSSLSNSSYLSSNQFYIAEKMGSLLKALPDRICDQMAWNGFVIVRVLPRFFGAARIFWFCIKVQVIDCPQPNSNIVREQYRSDIAVFTVNRLFSSFQAFLTYNCAAFHAKPLTDFIYWIIYLFSNNSIGPVELWKLWVEFILYPSLNVFFDLMGK